KKEVAKSKAHGVNIEFDGMTFTTILNIPSNNGICDYIKDFGGKSKYCNPLEITRKFANDETVVEARRIKSIDMKPFQRLLHIFMKKNIAPRFGKRDLTSFMDLTYMDYLLTRKKVNLPVIIWHMACVINVPQHELAYGELLTRVFEAYEVPLNDKEGEEPKRTSFFEETFLNMSQLRRENGAWWLGIGANKRRDEDENSPAENTQAENEGVNQQENPEESFEWEVVNEEAELQGEQFVEKHTKDCNSSSGDKFFDVVEDVDERSVYEVVP
ncbi:hypothetical protein Dimus_024683, partial [Dionaea muscipula]